MIRLGNEELGEEAVLRPGSRYAIFKIINDTMTARQSRVEMDRARSRLTRAST